MLTSWGSTSLAGSAFAQDVKVDYEKSFDFTTLKTFALKIGTAWGNPIGEKRVTAEIEGELIKKGWTKAEEAQANAVVMLHGATQLKKDLNTFYSGYGGYRWGGNVDRADDRDGVHGGHARRRHLRCQVEAARLPGHGDGRDFR